MYCKWSIRAAVGLVAASFIVFSSESVKASTIYLQVNLVSDVPGMAAFTDPNLRNPWGMSFTNTSPFWSSNQASNTSTLYGIGGVPQALIVSIPPIGTPPHGPTGQVAGPGGFVLSDGTAASFIFDTLDGQILGWNPGAVTTALNAVTTPGAVYTGLANSTVGGANFLYATDNTGHINVFDSTFQNVSGTTFAGKFVDPNPVAGFNPFNIQNINGNLFVTYGARGAGGFGLPGGFVDEFDSSGNFLMRVATSGPLAAPWGVALAPAGFGSFAGDLLIGNFGNGQILAYDPTTSNNFLGTVNDANGSPIVLPNLWALDFRSATSGFNPNALFFTAGINGQQDGLFGEIEVAPEPGTLVMAGTGIIVAVFLFLKKRHA
jgi:uncharacterized protein (TIGR03118 family)